MQSSELQNSPEEKFTTIEGRPLEARIVYVNIGVAVCLADSGRTTPRQFANSIRSELFAVSVSPLKEAA
jgi:hypothetical protein